MVFGVLPYAQAIRMAGRSLIRLARHAMLIVFVSLPLAAAAQVTAPYRMLLIGSTTSTEDSGLFPHLLPVFTKATGINTRVIALGTGRALELGRRGDVDVLLVHDRVAEDKFIAEGWGLPRRNVMYNDFVLIGPRTDRAGVRGRDILLALAKLSTSLNETFVSRGDRSGTHEAELRYWKASGIEAPQAKMAHYTECGCGQAQALSIASARGAYVLADRGTWLSFQDRGDLAVLVEGDPRLFNQYGVIVVNPSKHRQVRAEFAQAFADWIVSPDGQQTIASYKIAGQQLFFPNAGR
jgi:tungstate transport system substrate-binding protein